MSKKDSHNTDENLKIILNALDTVYPLLSQEDKEQIKLYTKNYSKYKINLNIQRIPKRKQLNFF